MRMNCHNQSKPFQWKLNYNYSILNDHGNAANMCIKKTGKKNYRYFPPCTVVKTRMLAMYHTPAASNKYT